MPFLRTQTKSFNMICDGSWVMTMAVRSSHHFLKTLMTRTWEVGSKAEMASSDDKNKKMIGYKCLSQNSPRIKPNKLLDFVHNSWPLLLAAAQVCTSTSQLCLVSRTLLRESCFCNATLIAGSYCRRSTINERWCDRVLRSFNGKERTGDRLEEGLD